MKILVLIDDPIIRENIKKIFDKTDNNFIVDYRFSYYENYNESNVFKSINIVKEYKNLIDEYDLIFSLCSQIFPKELVEKVRCINFHFGILPYACGVAPITFSMLNGIPVGYTVHLMNEKIDNGDIIFQQEVESNEYDTAKDIEIKCQNKLIEYLQVHLLDLIYGKYETYKQLPNRHYFSLKDFDNICKLDLEKKMTFNEFMNIMRALDLRDGSKAYVVSNSNEKYRISVKIDKI